MKRKAGQGRQKSATRSRSGSAISIEIDDMAGLRNRYGEWQKDRGEAEMQGCTEFVDRIRGRKHFSDKWICGADSVRTSNVCDHAHNDQHMHAMSLLKKQRAEASGLGLASYAPIAKAFNTLPEDKRDRLKVKFDIAYFIATEKLAFTKYPKICDLEARHGVIIVQ